MKHLPELFDRNRTWAAARLADDPGYFEELAAEQRPEFLWIGCADSRVPANEIVGLEPGQLFVHRNVANLVGAQDANALAVLQFAVEALAVPHVIVCGHYGCGGVEAAWRKSAVGPVRTWLRPVEEIASRHEAELSARATEGERVRRLCELNVLQQALNVCRTPQVQGAWSRGQPLCVHGWIYELRDGLLRDLGFAVAGPGELAEALASGVGSPGGPKQPRAEEA